MYIMIDNQDSFVYNLVSYMKILEKEIEVIPNESIDIEKISKNIGNIEGMIISPGPGNPNEYENVKQLVKQYVGVFPILGVCLGHQIIGAVFGANIVKGKRPMHGKVTEIFHNGRELFKEIDNPYNVTRYHSLIISETDLPKTLEVCAISHEGEIMAIKHTKYPLYGVQFHPEALLSENGIELLRNFTRICEESDKDNYME